MNGSTRREEGGSCNSIFTFRQGLLRCKVIELSEPLDELGAQVYRHVSFLVPPLMCCSRLRAMTTISLAMTLRATQNLSRSAAGEKAATCSSFVACR